MHEAVVYTSERDFRNWFESNLKRFGVSRIILSQEACPDYILEMSNGKIIRAEAELFAINFRYHGHDRAKVDLIIACYSKTPEIDGIPVLAANELWSEDTEILDPLPAEAPLSQIEEIILVMAHFSGGMDISAMPRRCTSDLLSGEQMLFFRLPPQTVKSFPRGKITDDIFNVVSPDAKEFMKKYHHVLIGAGLSAGACDALGTLRRRGLVEYRPMELAAALYDGVLIQHMGWVPTEVRATPKTWQLHCDTLLRNMSHRETKI